MRIHTNTLTPADVYAAARAAGPAVAVEWSRHGSRTRGTAYAVTLTGSSTHRPNRRPYLPDEYAATWDQWGMFLAALFTVDPDAVVPGVYLNAEHFRWSTGARFAPDGGQLLTPAGQHRQHRWGYASDSVTGSYSVTECTTPGCGAYWRRLNATPADAVHAWTMLSGVNA